MRAPIARVGARPCCAGGDGHGAAAGVALLLLTGLVALLALAPAAALASWSSIGGGPAHSGRAAAVSAQEPRPQVVGWPYETAGVINSSPVVAGDGSVYIGSDDGRVYALRPNGLVRWAYRVRGAVDAALGLGPDGTVYAVSQAGWLYAIRPNGSRRWRRRVGEGASPPVVGRNGAVYVGTPGGVLALRAKGSVLWRYRVRGGVEAAPAVGRGGGVVAPGADGRLHAVRRDGRRRWAVRLGANLAVPTLGLDGSVHVGDGAGRFHALGPGGRRRWTVRVFGPVVGAAAISRGGNVYVGSGKPGLGGRLTAFRSRGRRLWSHALRDSVFSSPAIGRDGTIYFGADDDRLHALRPNGRERWSYETGSAVDSSPAIAADGTLYVGSDDGSLYAFAAPPRRAGGRPPSERRLRAQLGHLVAPGGLTVAADGTVYVADFLRYGVAALSPGGRMTAAFGHRGRGPGRFLVPIDVAVAPGGDVYVADAGDASVQQFRPTDGRHRRYRFVRRWTSAGTLRGRLVQPLAIAVARSDGHVFVADHSHGIVAFTPGGRPLGAFSPSRSLAPRGLDIGPDGDVYATFGAKSGNPGDQSSYRLTPALRLRERLGLINPAGVPYLAIDRQRLLYISDALDPGVTKFEQVAGGFQELAFVLPPPAFHFGLAVDAASRIYVPAFANSPRPRGELRVYRPVRPGERASPYRLAGAWTGRRATTRR